MGDALELKFETPIPLVGQIMILEAVDYLYALTALGQLDWRRDYRSIPNWQESLVTAPGKLLDPENNLHVTHMYPGSVKEVVQGIAGAVEKLVEFLLLYREKKTAAQIKNLADTTAYIRHQLAPTLDRLKKNGVPERNIERTLSKAQQLLDEVLDELVCRNQLAIRNVNGAALPGYKCPRCGTVIGA